MQAMNLAIVDSYIEDIELQVLREYIDQERTPIQIALFSSALAQMWVFALYELLRTWRQHMRFLIEYGNKLRKLKGKPRKLHIEKHQTMVKRALRGVTFE